MTKHYLKIPIFPPSDPKNLSTVVIIPALDEEATIGAVVREIIGSQGCQVVVADNGSRDSTSGAAEEAGAQVVQAPRRGYGSACLAALENSKDADIFVFMDGDGSDDPSEIDQLLAPIRAGQADLVIGSRTLGRSERGALTLPQRFGNRLATQLIRLLYGVRFTDLGPFRAITRPALARLNMQDKDYGWTVEMQVKAVLHGIRCREVPVNYRKRRGGKSKVSGTLRGVFGAGAKILWTIAWCSFESLRGGEPSRERTPIEE